MGNSGLEKTLTQASNSGSADLIWMPNSSGGYDKYFYSTGTGFGAPPKGWTNVGNNEPADDVVITSGFIIERESASVNVKITPPSGYEDL